MEIFFAKSTRCRVNSPSWYTLFFILFDEIVYMVPAPLFVQRTYPPRRVNPLRWGRYNPPRRDMPASKKPYKRNLTGTSPLEEIRYNGCQGDVICSMNNWTLATDIYKEIEIALFLREHRQDFTLSCKRIYTRTRYRVDSAKKSPYKHPLTF